MTTYTKTHHSKAILAVLALLLVPGLAFAQAKKSSSSTMRSNPSTVPMARSNEVGTFALGGTLGLGFGDGAVGFKLTGNGYYTITEFTPQLPFDIGGHLGFSYFGCGVEGIDCSMKILELVPTARVRYKIIPKLSIFGDMGLGLALALPPMDGADSQIAFVLRFASGIYYQISEQLFLVGEPMGLTFYFLDESAFRYTISGGILYRF
jgi:hypothetical protein